MAPKKAAAAPAPKEATKPAKTAAAAASVASIKEVLKAKSNAKVTAEKGM
jgi:hypothetical protein